jgi:hypothetical protein
VARNLNVPTAVRNSARPFTTMDMGVGKVSVV